MRKVLLVPSLFLLVGSAANAGILNFGAGFAASQSLWQSGPNAGFDVSERTSGSVGLYFEAKANTGTVTSDVNGQVRTTFDSVLTEGSPTQINFDFMGSSSSFSSGFGASIETGVFLDISGCLGVPSPFGCVGIPYDIDTDIGIIDEGFFLDPSRDFTATLDNRASANQATSAAGVGSLDLVIGELGPSMDLDLDQTIQFTPTALNGTLVGRNLDTGADLTRSIDIDTTSGFDLDLDLGAGRWEFDLLNFGLSNTFRNDIDLELRPNFNYIVGEWPTAGNGLFGFGLIDETFSLAFNTIDILGSFEILVERNAGPGPGSVPGPGVLTLLAAGLISVTIVRRRRPGVRRV